MSGLGRTVFSRMLAALGRKARGTEEFGGRVIANTLILRRFVFYGGVIYCTGRLFEHWVLDMGLAEGMSMYPTMSEKTPYTFVSRLHSHGKNMSPGDMVNFVSPIFRDQLNGKRLIGASGDYVVLDSHQSPSVGGAPVPGITDWRSRAEIEKGVELREREEPMMVEVPEGHIYAVGDNMSWSRDSRFFGPVPMALVHGKQVAHSHGGLFRGWQFTAGEQMRKIPKEEEEEYLNGWKQRQLEVHKVAVQDKNASVAEEID